MKKKFTQQAKKFLQENPNGVIVITGPTASGKTSLSIQMAKNLNGEIINCDSRQVYTDMPIITAAPSEEEKKGIPHHLFEFLSPEKKINVMEWRSLAEEKIKEIQKRKKIPILCGGTGLFINALTKNFSVGVPPNPKFREKMEKFSGEELWEILEKKDQEESKKIPPQNKKYIIRALEICEAKGKKTEIAIRKEPKFPFLIFGITFPRKKLYERINLRNQIMFDMGILEEAKKVLEKFNLEEKQGAFISHGLPEIIKFFAGEFSEDEMKDKMKQNTRNYAKRQMTWWRKDDRVSWKDGDSGEENICIEGY